MKKITFLLSFLICAFSYGQSVATYKIEFKSVWNASDHGTLPNNAHWSPLVGANHNSNITYFEMNGIATQGIENIAETGNITEFRNNEVNPSVSNGDAEQFINGGGLSGATGTITIDNLEVNINFPLLTLVSMIAPSPDWIIGINSINLRNAANTDWRDLINIDLFAYDAGTDSGTNYNGPYVDITPHIPINSLQGDAPFNNNIIGTFTITLQSVVLGDDTVINNKLSNSILYPNPTHGKITISNLQNIDLKNIEIFSVLGKLVEQILVSNNKSKIDLDLSQYSKGMYLLKTLDSNGASYTQKLVIN